MHDIFIMYRKVPLSIHDEMIVYRFIDFGIHDLFPWINIG